MTYNHISPIGLFIHVWIHAYSSMQLATLFDAVAYLDAQVARDGWVTGI